MSWDKTPLVWGHLCNGPLQPILGPEFLLFSIVSPLVVADSSGDILSEPHTHSGLMGFKFESMTKQEKRGRSPGGLSQLSNTFFWQRGNSARPGLKPDSGSTINQLCDLEQFSSSCSQRRELGQRISRIPSNLSIL